MKKTEKSEKIALLHHAGGGNLGDEAIIQVLVENIRRRCQHAELVVFSMNPEDTGRRHGIQAEPIRRHTWSIGYSSTSIETDSTSSRDLKVRFPKFVNPAIGWCQAIAGEIAFLASSFRKLSRYSKLIISGGGQLTERSGPWGFPYAIFVWVVMAKLAGLRCEFLAVGAGPLKHPISRFLIARSLDAADYVSFRDPESQSLAREIGFTGSSSVCPDNAYSLQWDTSAISLQHRALPVVGLAPMPFPFCDPREYASDHQGIYEEYIRKFATFAASLAHDHSLELFGSDAGADASAIEDLRQMLQNEYGIAIPPSIPSRTVDELLSRMSEMDYIVTCRFHGVVMAHILNKPMIGIAHHPKITHLMQGLGLGEYCVDIKSFDPSDLSEMFARMVSRRNDIRRCLAVSLDEYRSAVISHFDLLFPSAKDGKGITENAEVVLA